MDNTNEKENTMLPQPERSNRTTGSPANEHNRVTPVAEQGVAASAEKGEAQPRATFQQATPANDDGAAGDDTTASTGASADSTSVVSDMPMIADDSDLIEKEWVSKAKQIVDQTKDDPYNQNKQIVRLRADYLKKRYNKDVKMQED